MRGAGGPGDDRPVMGRRDLFRIGGLALLAGPLAAACTGTPPKAAPDPLLPALDLALKDAALAKAAAAAFAGSAPTFMVISTVRQQHANALRAEVNRAAAVTSTTAPTSTPAPPKPASQAAATTGLVADFATARQQAQTLLPSLPRYRAGLVGSVAAGCASLAEALEGSPVTTTSATSANPAPSGGSPTLGSTAPSAGASLPTDTADALQNALDAENAALWLYGTASAFISPGVVTEVVAGMQAVQNLRDATTSRLTAGQVAPHTAQPAYLVPTPMNNQPTALTNLAVAESAATVAWRSVLEHTDDGALRIAALAALVDSAVRQTRWRRLAGQTPASVAMPGAGSSV